MRMELKLFAVFAMLGTFTSAHAVDICVSCELQGMPTNNSLNEIAKLAKNDKLLKNEMKPRGISSEPNPEEVKEVYQQKYCIRFEQIPKNEMGITIKEMEASPYKIEDYFDHSTCQTAVYSPAVKSPMIHYIADDPDKHEEKLNTIWLYYLKKRKEPEVFTKIINATNTKGETLLDLIESIKIKGGFGEDTLKGPIARIEAMICEHGGLYKTSKNKECLK